MLATARRHAAPLAVALFLVACQTGATPQPSATPSILPSQVPSQVPSELPSEGPSQAAADTHWAAAGELSVPRNELRAVAFEDGRVLVVGDDRGAELWSPTTNAWQAVPGLNKPRTNFALVRLDDGRALVIGGMNDVDQSYLSAFAFDPDEPDAGWTMADGLLGTARTDPGAALLADGRVLVVGGYFREAPMAGSIVLAGTVLADVAPERVGVAMATAEVFDPATGRFSPTGPMTYARYASAVTTLADGRVLVVGSRCTGEVAVAADACTSAEIYDPATGGFTPTTPMPAGDPAPTWMGTALPLDDGGALLIGRYGSMKYGTTSLRSYRYDAAAETWRPIGTPYELEWGRPGDPEATPFETPGVVPQFDALVAQLPGGRVVVAGGDSWYGDMSSTTFGQLYDPASDSWTDLPPLPEPRAGGAAVALPDGSVLLIGGHQLRGGPPGESPRLASTVRLFVGE